MKVVKKKKTSPNFKKNKPLMKLIAEGYQVASMNEVEEKEFYSGVYKCPLFKR